MRIRALIAVFCIALLCAGWVGATADQSAELTIDDSQEIPRQEIAFENEQFFTSSLKVADPGDTITVDVSIEPDEVYRVYIYDTDENIVDDRRGTEDASFSFHLSEENFPPGTYLMAVVQDGDYLAIHPLLVRGYGVSVDAPTTVERGATVSVSATVEYLRGRSLDHVEFVVTNGDERVRQRASKQADGSYQAEIDLSRLSPGDYVVYATVRADEMAFGENEFLGVNEGHTLTIRERETTTATDSQSSSSGGDVTETPTDAVTSTAHSPSPTPPRSPADTPTDTTPPTATRTLTGTLTATATSTVTVTPTSTSSPPDDSVITPDDDIGSPTSTQGQPGFGIAVTLSAVVGLVVLLLRE